MNFGVSKPKQRPLDPKLYAWTENIMREVRPDRLRTDVINLPAPRNRQHTPEAMARADELLLQGFRNAKWTVEHRPFTMTNVYGLSDEDYSSFCTYPRLDGANIVARKQGEDSDDALVVISHFDTIRTSPGADDNTASIAALLELARVLASHRFRRTIVLAAVDMEELGFFGAKALVAELKRVHRILGCINFETMAYMDSTPRSQMLPKGMGMLYPSQVWRIARRQWVGDFTVIIYNGPATVLAQSVGESLKEIAGAERAMLIRDPNDFPVIGKLLRRIVPAIRHFSRSDHQAFWEYGIPAIMVTDTANFRNPHYHKPTDTPEKLDYEHLAKIVGATAVAVARIAGLCL